MESTLPYLNVKSEAVMHAPNVHQMSNNSKQTSLSHLGELLRLDVTRGHILSSTYLD